MEHLGDMADILEDIVDAIQQLRYGNKEKARLKIVNVTNAAKQLNLAMLSDYGVVTANSEDSDP